MYPYTRYYIRSCLEGEIHQKNFTLRIVPFLTVHISQCKMFFFTKFYHLNRPLATVTRPSIVWAHDEMYVFVFICNDSMILLNKQQQWSRTNTTLKTIDKLTHTNEVVLAILLVALGARLHEARLLSALPNGPLI